MSSLYECARSNAAGYRDILPAEVAATPGRAVRIVDVREPHEFTGELGHIGGAELVPLASVEALAAKSWRKDDEIVLVCRSGGRSARAAASLAALGFRRVMNMLGGMLAWNEARLPVEVLAGAPTH
jgi:sulfur-carrier protein adenylyltransferase/sulfurtransferase